MRHLMSSFLALHWAAFFALLAYLCIDAGSFGAASAMLGVNVNHDAAGAVSLAAPVTVTFLVVAALFCWLFVETCFGESGLPDSVVKIAFVAGGAVLSLFLIGGAVHDAAGSPLAAAYLTALIASYMAVLGECRAAIPRREKADASLPGFVRDAADMSLLGRISRRPGLERDR